MLIPNVFSAFHVLHVDGLYVYYCSIRNNIDSVESFIYSEAVFGHFLEMIKVARRS